MTLTLSVALSILASPVAAQFLDRMAREAYAEGRFADALTLFGEVAEEAPTPQVFYNMALAAELAGDPTYAFSLFERYLELSDEEGSPRRRKHARDQIAALSSRLALVRVDSTPPGASISIDGRAQETFARTPARLPLPPGRHKIRLSLPGYESEATETTVERGKQAAVALELSREKGILRVELDFDAPAEVTLTDETGRRRVIEVGTPTYLDAGRYEMRVEAISFKPWVRPVVVVANETVVRPVSLVALLPEEVKVLVRCRQGSKDLWVDGIQRASTPVTLQIPVGDHVLEVRDQGETLWRKTVPLQPGRNVLVDIDLEGGPEGAPLID